MNRKQRRELRKDKNLVKELYSIIVKYLPKLLDMFNDLTDTRNQAYVTYSMKNHYFFIQFAHTIRQLLEQGNILTKSLKLKIKEVSAYLLKALTSTTTDLNKIETSFQLRFDT